MALSFTSADASSYMSYSAGDFAGSGAFTMAFLIRNDNTTGNGRYGNWMATSTEQMFLLEDTGEIFGQGDFTGHAAGTAATWKVVAISKAAGSDAYRGHYWEYASDGSGTMTHGDTDAHADFSAATTCRVGWGSGTSHDGDIAVAAFWDSELSDSQLDTLKSGSLAAWTALAPDLGVHYGAWGGSSGDIVFSGSSGAGTVNGGVITSAANPTSFDFLLPATPVDHFGTGTAVAGTTSVTPTLPASWVAGDLAVVVVASNHATTESTEPACSGYTKVGTLNGGGGAQGAGTGNRRLTYFIRVLQSGDSDPTVTLSTGNVMIAATTVLRFGRGYAFLASVLATGAETTAGTGWTQAMTSDPGIGAADCLVLGCAVRDTSNSSAEGITATGATFGTVTERADLSSETGNDLALHVATCLVATGPGSAAPTRTATHSTSETGVMGVLRVRAVRHVPAIPRRRRDLSLRGLQAR